MDRLSYIVGVLCWLLVSLTPAQASAATKLALGDLVIAVEEKVESCQKLTTPAPVNHQCSGVPAQTAATTRLRDDDKGKPAPLGLSVLPSLQSNADPLQPITLPYVWTAIHPRRSNFWHVFARAHRMRN